MTNEKLLGKLNEALKYCNEEQTEAAKYMREAGIKETKMQPYLCNTGAVIQELIFSISNEIREKEMKSSGKLNAQKAAKNILKRSPNYKPMLQYPHYEDGKQIVLSPYIMAVFGENNHVALDEKPEKVKGEFPDWKKLIPSHKGKKVNLFDFGKLKAWYKIQETLHRKEKNYKWEIIDFGAEYDSTINMEFVIDAMEICGADCCCYVTKSKYVFEGNGNVVVAMGITPEKNAERKRTEID